MKRPSCTIGVDIGTTSVKALAINHQQSIIYRAQSLLEIDTDENGTAEQNPETVYQMTNKVLLEVVQGARTAGYEIAQIGFSAAMHSVFAVSSDNLPLMPAMTWMDTKAKAHARALWHEDAGRALYLRTGTPIHAMSPLVKLLWLKQTHPDIYSGAHRFVSLKEWVWYRWFGEWAIDESMASATGMFNLSNRAWDAEALRRAGITANQLSSLVSTTYTNTQLQDTHLLAAGLTPQTTFCIGATDGVLANLASGVVDSSEFVLTVGTSLALRTGSNEIVTDETFRPFCYVLDENNYVVGGPSNSGGVALDWLMRKVLAGTGDPPDAADFSRRLAEAEHVCCDGLLFVPYLAGERAPLWDEEATGAFVGLTLQHEGAHLVRAVVEGILLNAYWIGEKLIRRLGMPKRMIVSGHIFESPWICQLTADLFNIPILHFNDADASTLGAILLADLACGMLAEVDPDQSDASAAASSICLPAAAAHVAKMKQFAKFQSVVQHLQS